MCSAREEALNSTGSVTSEKTTASAKQISPIFTSGSHEKRSPSMKSGTAALEPMEATGAKRLRKVSGA